MTESLSPTLPLGGPQVRTDSYQCWGEHLRMFVRELALVRAAAGLPGWGQAEKEVRVFLKMHKWTSHQQTNTYEEASSAFPLLSSFCCLVVYGLWGHKQFSEAFSHPGMVLPGIFFQQTSLVCMHEIVLSMVHVVWDPPGKPHLIRKCPSMTFRQSHLFFLSVSFLISSHHNDAV